MPDVKFVIGANYGDEGKGLVSANLAANAQQRGESCLTVLYNGGAQRGGDSEPAEKIAQNCPEKAWPFLKIHI